MSGDFTDKKDTLTKAKSSREKNTHGNQKMRWTPGSSPTPTQFSDATIELAVVVRVSEPNSPETPPVWKAWTRMSREDNIVRGKEGFGKK